MFLRVSSVRQLPARQCGERGGRKQGKGCRRGGERRGEEERWGGGARGGGGEGAVSETPLSPAPLFIARFSPFAQTPRTFPWAPASRLQPVQKPIGFFSLFFLFFFSVSLSFWKLALVRVSLLPSFPAHFHPLSTSPPPFFFLETWPGQWLLEEEQVWEKREETGAK